MKGLENLQLSIDRAATCKCKCNVSVIVNVNVNVVNV